MPTPRYRLWIDGVGCWNLIFDTRWSIGGPASGADFELLAPLDANAAEISCKDESLNAIQDGVARRLVTQDLLSWSSGVQLRFQQPHPWTPSATLTPESSHRPADQSDGLILGAGPCVLGPEPDCHVVCRDWPHGLVLFRHDNTLNWKRFDGPLDANPVNRVGSDALIETDDVRVSIETLERSSGQLPS